MKITSETEARLQYECTVCLFCLAGSTEQNQAKTCGDGKQHFTGRTKKTRRGHVHASHIADTEMGNKSTAL